MGLYRAVEKCLPETCAAWPRLSLYERFEQVVALFLTFLIAIVIAVSLWHLARNIFTLLILGILDPLDHAVFQAVFGMIMTVLIALEFKHSILQVLHRREHIVQVRTVLLIALLALARKFIILDIKAIPPWSLAALGLAVLALGGVYWLIAEREDVEARMARTSLPDVEEQALAPGDVKGP